MVIPPLSVAHRVVPVRCCNGKDCKRRQVQLTCNIIMRYNDCHVVGNLAIIAIKIHVASSPRCVSMSSVSSGEGLLDSSPAITPLLRALTGRHASNAQRDIDPSLPLTHRCRCWPTYVWVQPGAACRRFRCSRLARHTWILSMECYDYAVVPPGRIPRNADVSTRGLRSSSPLKHAWHKS